MENPFLLWGSYVGLAVGLVFSYFSFAAIFALAELGMFRPIALILPVFPAVIGFLCGWLVHWLVKFFIKKI